MPDDKCWEQSSGEMAMADTSMWYCLQAKQVAGESAAAEARAAGAALRAVEAGIQLYAERRDYLKLKDIAEASDVAGKVCILRRDVAAHYRPLCDHLEGMCDPDVAHSMNALHCTREQMRLGACSQALQHLQLLHCHATGPAVSLCRAFRLAIIRLYSGETSPMLFRL